MCGIFFYKSDSEKDIVDYANKCQHRGPDNTKSKTIIYNNNHLYFVFHRLSINGLNSKSDQPFYKKNNILICNGEIYNYKSLAERYNIKLESDSDCEIILHLYEILDINTLCNSLDGVFSFVLYDGNKHNVIVGHDPYGIRSLYSFHNGNNIGFSSEMKCLYDLDKNIKFFPPGSYSIYNIDTNIYATYKYYDMIFPIIDYNENDTIKNIRKLLYDSVNKRTITDRPIGCLLSGGLDSSIIASIMSKSVPNLKTFSIGLKGSPDLHHAQNVAEFLNTNHTNVLVTEKQMLDMIENTIYQIESYDITTIRASTPMYLLSRKIKAMGVKMVLSGEGADELMGGYLYFLQAPSNEEFQSECQRRVRELSQFDCLRANKSTMSWGVEGRFPFLDKKMVDVSFKIHPSLKKINGIEKYVLRKAFDIRDSDGNPTYLPDSILWRQKEQFGDGVGYNWIDSIKEMTSNMYTDDEFTN